MKKLTTFIAGIALAVASHAGQISGTIEFDGDVVVDEAALLAGNAVLDFGEVIARDNTIANPNLRTGDFSATLQGNIVGNLFNDITITGGAVNLPIAPLWKVTEGIATGGSSAWFDMTSAEVFLTDIPGFGDQLDFFTVVGKGVLHMDGFDATAGEFFYSSENNHATFSASAQSVASPGMAALLGLGLTALGLSRRQA